MSCKINRNNIEIIVKIKVGNHLIKNCLSKSYDCLSGTILLSNTHYLFFFSIKRFPFNIKIYYNKMFHTFYFNNSV